MPSPAPTPVRSLLVSWITLSFLLSWLPLLRCLMDGPSYQWGTQYFGVQFRGAGLSGDLWLLLLQTALGVWLIFRGWRDPSPPFAAAVLGWLAFRAADGLHSILSGQGLHFEGATLGVNLSLGMVVPLLHVFFLGLAAWWVLRHGEPMRLGGRAEWTGTNSTLLGAVILLFPVQFVLLRAGRGQEASDVMGVLLTISQWFLFSAALYPWQVRSSAPAAVPAITRQSA